MNLRGRRNKVKLSLYTMAKELGLDYKTYKNIEDNRLDLPKEKIDQFVAVCSRAKEINLNRMMKMKQINYYFESKSYKQDMDKLGYTQQKELAHKIGIDKAAVCVVFNGKGTDDNKERIYDFLKNCLNKKIDDDKTEEKIIAVKPVIEEVIEEIETKTPVCDFKNDIDLTEIKLQCQKLKQENDYLKELLKRIIGL